eukprot:TRINITY_DN10503_c0_g1_i1.p1 TRINITY_DN10503_c0_g1~~TRINITY_DN10503_c0_g1_i1.p1  ORF type:complete len:211 (-),score=43.78 TRINITY_DN10503_c0_g1_i1:884-1450(-)
MSRRVVNVDSNEGGTLNARFAIIQRNQQAMQSRTSVAQSVSRPVIPAYSNTQTLQTRFNPGRNIAAGVTKTNPVKRGALSNRGNLNPVKRGTGQLRGGGRGRGRGIGGPIGVPRGGTIRGRGGRGAKRGQGEKRSKEVLSKHELDRQLDAYMLRDEKFGQELLDKELEEYMSNRQESNGEARLKAESG